ncbi:MAG: ribokinase [Verrucomicrobiota bacterium]
MSKIVVIGSSNTDIVIKSRSLPKPGETVLGEDYLMNPGGKGANQAVAAAKLGGSVAFIAKVGDDDFGRGARQNFARFGIDVSHISIDPDKPSGVAAIMVDDAGENSISVAPGANNALGVSEVKDALPVIEAANVVLLQLESPLETVEFAIRSSRGLGKTVILNPAPACALPGEFIAQLDVITPNETEAEILSGIPVKSIEGARKAAEVLKAMGVRAVVLTLGARGAFVLSDAFDGLIPVEPADAIDTTAAGDTFNGALAVALAEGRAIEHAVAFANRAGAISVTRMGAQASAPFREELPEPEIKI